MVFVSMWTQVHMNTWMLKRLHVKHTIDNNLNIQTHNSNSQCYKKKGRRRERKVQFTLLVTCSLLSTLTILNAQCPTSPPGFFVLSWQKKGEAKKLDGLDLQHAVFWLCSWKSWTTGWTWASHSVALNLTFQICRTEKIPLPSYFDEASWGQMGFQVF